MPVVEDLDLIEVETVTETTTPTTADNQDLGNAIAIQRGAKK